MNDAPSTNRRAVAVGGAIGLAALLIVGSVIGARPQPAGERVISRISAEKAGEAIGTAVAVSVTGLFVSSTMHTTLCEVPADPIPEG